MKRTVTFFSVVTLSALLLCGFNATAQNKANDEEFKPHGTLWGYAFGDYAYKANADSVGGGRGGSNQYTKVVKNTNLFQWRRIYLGYDYEISKKFSAEFLLAAEDDFQSGALGQGNGDILVNNKFSPYVKIANIRMKNVFPGADLVFGQSTTPTFAKQGKNAQTSEEVWGYRSIERTITDVRRTGSYDMGIKLEGTLPKNDNFGYIAMIGNGTGAKPENDAFKWFYGDIFAKFMNKHLIMDLYVDYQKMVWMSYSTPGGTAAWHDDRQMTKLFVAYTVPKFTVGVEYFMNRNMGDIFAKRITAAGSRTQDTITAKSTGLSIFAKGRIYKDKLGFFARYDMFDPSGNINNGEYSSYSTAKISQYDVNAKESFLTLGLDWTPIKSVHIMPNIWYNTYANTNTTAAVAAVRPDGNDMVYRLTFYWRYGK